MVVTMTSILGVVGKIIATHYIWYTYTRSGSWINIKMPSYQYRKSHCGDKTILRPSYLHSGISYTGKTTSLYWTRALMFFYILLPFRRVAAYYKVHPKKYTQTLCFVVVCCGSVPINFSYIPSDYFSRHGAIYPTVSEAVLKNSHTFITWSNWRLMIMSQRDKAQYDRIVLYRICRKYGDSITLQWRHEEGEGVIYSMVCSD